MENIPSPQNQIDESIKSFSQKKLFIASSHTRMSFCRRCIQINGLPSCFHQRVVTYGFQKMTLTSQDPCVINHQDGRVIFFIPLETQILVGTTEEGS